MIDGDLSTKILHLIFYICIINAEKANSSNSIHQIYSLSLSVLLIHLRQLGWCEQ